MNNERREELLDVCQYLDDAVDRLIEIRDDEQDAFDNLPEGIQNSVRGDAMQEAIETLDLFEASITDIRDKLEEYSKPKKRQKQ